MGIKIERKVKQTTNAAAINSDTGVTSESESDVQSRTVLRSQSKSAYDSDTSVGSCPPLENIPLTDRPGPTNSTPELERADFNSSAPPFDVIRPRTTVLMDKFDKVPSNSACTPISHSRPVSRTDTFGSGNTDVGQHATDIRLNSRPQINTENASMIFTSEATQNFVSSIVDLANAVRDSNVTSQQNHCNMSDLLLKTNETMSEMSRVTQHNATMLQNQIKAMSQQCSRMQDVMSDLLFKDRQPPCESVRGPNTVTSPQALSRPQRECERQLSHETARRDNSVTSHAQSRSRADLDIAYLGVNVLNPTPSRSTARPSRSCHTFLNGQSQQRSRHVLAAGRAVSRPHPVQ